MRWQLLMFSLALLVLCAGIASGATLQGTIYDLSLNKVNNAIVTVDSQPTQRYLASNGTYSFELEPGSYILETRYVKHNVSQLVARDRVEINSEGTYVYDIFLFPSFEEEESMLNSTASVPIQEEEEKATSPWMYVVIVILMAALIIGYLFARVLKKARQVSQEMEGDYTQEVIQFLKSNQGRATQKQIRKQLPLSEAKVSLIITELEDRGIVRRIKRGRGNVIILQKK